MENSAILYQLGLSLVPGIGATLARKLLEETGSAQAIFQEKASTLTKINGIGSIIAKNISGNGILQRADQEIEYMQKHKIKMMFFYDPDYPERLKNCADAPIVFFHKGDIPSRMSHSLSIIGTRKPSRHGRDLTISWVQALAQKYPDIYIISGLAYGIDITAHEAALKNNVKTLAVLGHGFHTIYPSEHRSAAIRILEEGALMTDFFSHNMRETKNFIRRNRIIAGLSEATLVVESKIKGGAMATVEMANSYNRDVFAIPGRPTDIRSVGCNYLIRSNQAILASTPDDIPFILDWEMSNGSKKGSKVNQILPELSDSQKRLMDVLQKDELNINELGIILHVHPAKLTGDLLNLEFSGLIQASPGGRFRSLERYI